MLHNSEIASALAYLEQNQVVTRIWSGDHTVWKPDPTEIADRLGWLTVTDLMRQQASDLASFAAEVRDVGSNTLSCWVWAAAAWDPRYCARPLAAPPVILN
jgi:hypothetical protein